MDKISNNEMLGIRGIDKYSRTPFRTRTINAWHVRGDNQIKWK